MADAGNNRAKATATYWLWRGALAVSAPLALIFALVPVAAQPQYDALKSTSDAMRDGSFEAERRRLIEITKQQPKSASALLELGKFLRDNEKYNDAIAALKKAIPLDPGRTETYKKLGETFEEIGDNKSALESYDGMLKQHPDDLAGMSYKARALRKLRRAKEAVALYSFILTKRPNRTTALEDRAATLVEMAEYEKAITDYNALLKADPDRDAVYGLRATAFLKTGQPQNAIKDWTRVVRANPDDASVFRSRGDLYFQLGQYQKAADDYTSGLKVEPRFARSLYVSRSKAYAKMGRTNLAKQDEKKAIELSQTKPARADGDADIGLH